MGCVMVRGARAQGKCEALVGLNRAQVAKEWQAS